MTWLPEGNHLLLWPGLTARGRPLARIYPANKPHDGKWQVQVYEYPDRWKFECHTSAAAICDTVDQAKAFVLAVTRLS